MKMKEPMMTKAEMKAMMKREMEAMMKKMMMKMSGGMEPKKQMSKIAEAASRKHGSY